MIFTDRKNLTVLELTEEREAFSYDELIPVLMEMPSNVIYIEVNRKLNGMITMGRISRNWIKNGAKVISPNKNFTSVFPGEYYRAKKTFSENAKIEFLPVVDSERRLLGEYRQHDDDIILQQADFFSGLPDMETVFASLNDIKTVLVQPNTSSRKKWELFQRCGTLLEGKGVLFSTVNSQEAAGYFDKDCNIITIDWIQRAGLEALCKYILVNYDSIKPHFLSCAELFYNLHGNVKNMIKVLQEKNIHFFSIDVRENERGYLREFERQLRTKYEQYHIEPRGQVAPEFRKEFLGELDAQFAGIELPLELPGVCLKNNVWVLRDVNTPTLHISEGRRHTVDQPESYEHCVYMCGPCIILGSLVEDQYTIPSLLQKKLNQAGFPFKVINLGIPGSRGNVLSTVARLLEENIAEGDIVVFDAQDTLFDGIPCLNLVNVLEEKQISVNWFTDHPRHCNHKVNQVYMEAIYQEILPALKNSLPAGMASEKGEDFIKKLYIDRYFTGFEPSMYKTVGSIVMNCNPFTFGHRYLIQTALEQVDFLIIFVVQEDLSIFSFAERFAMVRNNTADLANVMVVPSGEFILSRRTFPEYFKKETDAEITENTESDIRLFAEKIAPTLGITHRFAGEELEDEVTDMYNQAMRQILPTYGIRFVEIPRKKNGNSVISASRVRKCLQEGNWEQLERLIPEATRQVLFYEDK